MSEDGSGRPPHEWRFYLEDMIGFAKKVLAYTDGFDPQAFVSSGINYEARSAIWS